MNKKVPEITESVEELKVLLRKCKKKHEVQRLTALYLLKSGQAKNRVQAAARLGVDRMSVGQWLRAYETGGLEKLLERGYAPGRVSILTEDQQALLRSELQKPKGFQSYVEIQAYIADTFGVKMNYKTVYSMVRGKWGAKLKVPRPSHEKKTEKTPKLSQLTFLSTSPRRLMRKGAIFKTSVFSVKMRRDTGFSL